MDAAKVEGCGMEEDGRGEVKKRYCEVEPTLQNNLKPNSGHPLSCYQYPRAALNIHSLELEAEPKTHHDNLRSIPVIVSRLGLQRIAAGTLPN